MDVGETRKPRELLVQPRIVLHGARAERIEARINRGIALGEPDVMAHGLGLGKSRKTGRRLARKRAQAILERRRFRKVHARLAFAAEFENERLLVVEAAMARDGLRTSIGLAGDKIGRAALA